MPRYGVKFVLADTRLDIGHLFISLSDIGSCPDLRYVSLFVRIMLLRRSFHPPLLKLSQAILHHPFRFSVKSLRALSASRPISYTRAPSWPHNDWTFAVENIRVNDRCEAKNKLFSSKHKNLDLCIVSNPRRRPKILIALV